MRLVRAQEIGDIVVEGLHDDGVSDIGSFEVFTGLVELVWPEVHMVTVHNGIWSFEFLDPVVDSGTRPLPVRSECIPLVCIPREHTMCKLV